MINLKNKLKEIKLNGKKLCLIADSDGFASENDFLDGVASALLGGAEIVLLREKNSPAKKILELGKKVRELCLQFDATFIVKERIDIAFLLEADGVHLEQDGLGVKDAREIMGENAIVGVSVCDSNQASKAVQDGADYLFFGPLFKDGEEKKANLKLSKDLKWIYENIQIPVFAFGGIDFESVQEVLDIGVKRVAVENGVFESSSPEKSVEEFLSRLG